MRRQQCTAQMLVCAATLVCLLAVPALAQDCPELVGRLPGPLNAVAVSGDYAYLGGGSTFTVADVSDPSAARIVGNIDIPGGASGVAASGNYAFVVGPWDGADELRVIDVSTPSAPVEVGHLYWPGGVWARSVAVSGSYAYVAAETAGLRVIDVSTPSAPVEIGFVNTPGSARDVAVSRGYAYVAVGLGLGGGLSVIDVSTPSAPVEVGYVETSHELWDVAVSGDYAYVAGLSEGLRIIDVHTPSAPVEVGFVNTPGTEVGVAVEAGYAYVAGSLAGLRVIDVSTPTAPVEVGFLDTYRVDAVAVAGGNAFVATGSDGFRVVDVSAPSAPVAVGFVDTIYAGDIAVEASHAYIAAGDLEVIDLSAPSAPVVVGRWGGGLSAVVGVEVDNAYAYAVTYGCGEFSCYYHLDVVDVSTPSSPVRVGHLDMGSVMDCSVTDVTVSGSYVYVACTGSLRVIDVSVPSAPAEVGHLYWPGEVWAPNVAVSGDYAYVTWSDPGAPYGASLRIIDVSTPSAPVEVGFVNTPGPANGLAVSGDYVYVAWGDWDSGQGGLRVIDVSTPSAPVDVGHIGTPNYARDVAVSGDYAYVAWAVPYTGYEGGLRVIDVTWPSAPVEVSFYDTPPSPAPEDEPYLGILGVTTGGGYVFLAAGRAGLSIFGECGPLPDARECFIPAAAVAAGAQGAFFQTDVEINNTGAEEAQVAFQWLPRGQDNSEPMESDPITLGPGHSVRYENVLTELFGLGPDSLGALKMTASTESVIGMSRTYNIPGSKAAGTFGQGLPAIRATEMIMGADPQRIIFLSENDDSRANVGCVNGSSDPVTINIGIFDDEGVSLETRTMVLGPWSNDQINRIFEGYAPVNGYVDVWADSEDALYYCYGSMLDNETSDPTTILPQAPSDDVTFIPAAALAAGLEGSFFETDIDLNNVGSTDLTYELLWLPRGADNSEPVSSETFSLAPGAGVRYANVLDEVFGLAADQVGALAVEASGIDLLAMSRTYNLPSAKVAGTFGQELPGIPADRMIPTGVKKRIIFLSEDDDSRANVGCVNGAGTEVAVAIELYGSDGVKLETTYMMLPPYSSRQINGVFQDHAPINGYVDVRTYTPDALIYCYGSVLDNITSDPTTVLPQ